MINATDIIQGTKNITSQSDFISYTSQKMFVPSILSYWIFQFLLTLIIGMILVRKDKGNFFAIFLLTQLIGGIFLLFIFWFPIIPQFIDKLGLF
jgi:hypothetical protein